MKIKIADMIYILNIQKKNKHIKRVMDKYGLDHSGLPTIEKALHKGRWRLTD